MWWELEDSEIAALTWAGGTATLRLSAARVLDASGRSGSGEGAWQPLQLMLDQAQLQAGQSTEALGRVRSGTLHHAGQRLRQLPLPWQANGPVQLELEMAHGAWLQLQAASAVLALPPQACAVEALQC